MFYFSDYSRRDDLDNSMIFNNCTFSAHIGSAIDMAPNIFKLSTGFVIVPKFIILKNEVRVQTQHGIQIQKTAGVGTTHASLFDIHFHGHNYFKNNGVLRYM